jgi:hypothetical protein
VSLWSGFSQKPAGDDQKFYGGSLNSLIFRQEERIRSVKIYVLMDESDRLYRATASFR